MYELRTHSESPQSYADQVRLISEQAIQQESIEEFTWRDVAVAMDLWQRYIELLDAMMEDIEITGDDSVIVQLKTVKLKLKSVEQIADWIPNGNQEP